VPSATPGERASVEAARRYADTHDWATPDRWADIDHDMRPRSPQADVDIDQVAISRVVDGQPTQLNHRERRRATQRLTAQGLSLRDIAARLAIHPRTVSRYRRDLAQRNDLRNQQAPASRQRHSRSTPTHELKLARKRHA
jgi:DNA-binding CsgD family transcriptional regulator